MILRKGTTADLDELAAIESACFPPEQAAGREQFRWRLEIYPQHFLLLCDEKGKIISFVDGFVTDISDLTDEMYSAPTMHDESGAWQMIFGLNTLPEYRRRQMSIQLIGQATSVFRALGRDTIRVALPADNVEALDFFRSSGFAAGSDNERADGAVILDLDISLDYQ